MIKGFSVLEVIVVSTISVLILCIVIAAISESTHYSKRMTSKQEKMESIFHTVDSIRSDLTKCGKRIQEASLSFDFPMFVNTDSSFKVIYGMEDELLMDNCWQGERELYMNRNDFFSKNKKILVYNRENGKYEFNRIDRLYSDRIVLAESLQNDYPKYSMAVVIKEVEYKIYLKQKILKRKVNSGYFQPVMEDVTDFFVKYFPEAYSVFYRIEVGQKEQVRGYIFMPNMVEQ